MSFFVIMLTHILINVYMYVCIIYIYIGATVRLYCRNTKYSLFDTATTDKNGYFLIKPKFPLTTYGVHKCKVSLVSSPDPYCQKPSILHDGHKGGILRPDDKSSTGKHPFVFYNVGPFAFEPKCTH